MRWMVTVALVLLYAFAFCGGMALAQPSSSQQQIRTDCYTARQNSSNKYSEVSNWNSKATTNITTARTELDAKQGKLSPADKLWCETGISDAKSDNTAAGPHTVAGLAEYNQGLSLVTEADKLWTEGSYTSACEKYTSATTDFKDSISPYQNSINYNYRSYVTAKNVIDFLATK